MCAAFSRQPNQVRGRRVQLCHAGRSSGLLELPGWQKYYGFNRSVPAGRLMPAAMFLVPEGGRMRYSRSFYEVQRMTSIESARVIIPLVIDLVQPRSVIDFGCGVGAWLSACAENGVQEVRGIDGPWVERRWLVIPPDRFVAADLTQPIDSGKRYDLAMSLEVGEHLRAEYAPTFVESLCRAAPVVLFSAAIPHQGGTRHYNEQWPAYWASLFQRSGYVCVDCIREKVWNDSRVHYWYAQNTLLFIESRTAQERPKLAPMMAQARDPLALVHPRAYLGLVRYKFITLHHIFDFLASVRRRRRAVDVRRPGQSDDRPGGPGRSLRDRAPRGEWNRIEDLRGEIRDTHGNEHR